MRGVLKNWLRLDYRKVYRLKPEGWIDTLVFEFGYFGSCGKAVDGLGIHIQGNVGGVIANEDLVILKKKIEKHLKSVEDKQLRAREE